MVTDWSKFETFEESTGQQIPTKREEVETPFSNAAPTDWSKFEEIPEKESFGKAMARAAYQPFSGYAQATTWPADMFKAIASPLATAYARDEMSQMGDLSQEEKNAFMEGSNLASKHFDEYAPTQSNIERGVENLTGLPLQPRTTLDKVLHLGGTAGGFRGGAFLDGMKLAPGAQARAIEKGAAAMVAPAFSQGLQRMGVSESTSDNIGLLLSQLMPIPKTVPTGTNPIIKKSGMPKRNFESITKPTKISESYHGEITQNIETDVRQATDKLFSEASPTYVEMKTNPGFRDERIAGMEDVKNLASGLTRKVDSNTLRNQFVRLVNKRLKESGGVAQSEFDRELLRESRLRLKGILKDTPVSAKQLTEQYRKGNVSRGKLFELGSSTSRNEAKQETERLLNEATSDIIQRHYPQTEFAKKFVAENKAWSDMEAANNANGFVDSLFTPEGINFNNAKKLLKDNSQTRNLRRMLGKDKFNQLKEIANDFVNQGNKYKLLKPVESASAGSMSKDALLSINHPMTGGISLAKKGLHNFQGRGLQNVSSTVNWSKVPQNPKTGLAKIGEDVYNEFN